MKRIITHKLFTPLRELLQSFFKKKYIQLVRFDIEHLEKYAMPDIGIQVYQITIYVREREIEQHG